MCVCVWRVCVCVCVMYVCVGYDGCLYDVYVVCVYGVR